MIAAPSGLGTRPILDRAKTVLFDVLGHRLAGPGRLPPVAVLDLFAGSGALGLEALSRGASYCLLVERNQRAAALIRRNLDALQVIREAHVLEASAVTAEFPPAPAAFSSDGCYGLVFLDPPYRMLSTRGAVGGQEGERERGGGPEASDLSASETQRKSRRRPARKGAVSAGARQKAAWGRPAGWSEAGDASSARFPSPEIRRLLGRLATDSVIDPSAIIVVRHDFERGGGPDLSPLVELDRRDVGSMTLRLLTPTEDHESIRRSARTES